MKTFYHPYQLKQIDNTTIREGALLKMEFKDGSIGYADCHPWVEHGDDSLEDQLKKLQKGETTRVTDRCLYFAQVDATARMQNRSLFDGLQIPKSNWLITSIETCNQENIKVAVSQNFTCFKVKVGNNLDQEILFLQQLAQWLSPINFKLRLDFNLKTTEGEFTQFLTKIESLWSKIDYIEDPFTFDSKRWAAMQKQYPVKLACDYHSQLALGHPEAAPIVLIKPAIQDAALFLASLEDAQQLVITSYMDHPFGQVTAAYVAALCYEKLSERVGLCGLVSHQIYEPNDFSRLLSVTDTRLNPPKGAGFGFDALLNKLTWTSLS